MATRSRRAGRQAGARPARAALSSAAVAAAIGACPRAAVASPPAASEAGQAPDLESPDADAAAPQAPPEPLDPPVADDPLDAPARVPGEDLPPADPALDGLLEPTPEPPRAAHRPESAPDEPREPRDLWVEAVRPRAAPARLNASVRGSYLFGSAGDSSTSMRMGGAVAELSAAFNHVAIGGAVTAVAGLFFVDPERARVAYTLVGGGPTVGLGRLGMNPRGLFDVDLGADVMYAGSTDTPYAEPDRLGGRRHEIFVGPRARLTLGLWLRPDARRDRFHGLVGALGWQLLADVGTRAVGPTNAFMLQVGWSTFGSGTRARAAARSRLAALEAGPRP